MKYEKFIKIAIGIVAVAVFFVLPTMASATVTNTPTISSIATDNIINNVEKAAIVVNGTVTATSSGTQIITVLLSQGANGKTASTTINFASTTWSVTIDGTAGTPFTDGGGSIVASSTALATGCTLSATSTAVIATQDTVAPTFSAVRILSNNASTTLAKVANVVTLYATSSETITASPTVAFTFNSVASASSSVVTHISGNSYMATVAASSTDADGAVGFTISGYSDTAGNPGSSQTAVTTGPTVTFDKTAPTVSTVVWNDVDGSTNINAGDTIVVTFSEAMATTTISTTTLALSGTDTFGNSTLAWSGTSSSTILTVTLGSSSTVASGDTINPTSATDAAGNAYSTATHAITDSTAPLTPVASLTAGMYTSTQSTTLTSTGASNIYYTLDNTTPSCSSTLYSGAITISSTLTLQAVGCDTVSNMSPVLSNVYVIIPSSGGSSGGGGGGGYSYVAPPVAPITQPSVAPVSPVSPVTPKTLTGNAFSKDLSVGVTGDDVIALQTFLEQSGYLVMPKGVAKGYFGGLTKKAVMWFQKDVGLPTPGRVGPLTRAILNKGQ